MRLADAIARDLAAAARVGHAVVQQIQRHLDLALARIRALDALDLLRRLVLSRSASGFDLRLGLVPLGAVGCQRPSCRDRGSHLRLRLAEPSEHDGAIMGGGCEILEVGVESGCRRPGPGVAAVCPCRYYSQRKRPTMKVPSF